jgi:hypothetical protein
MTGRERRQGVKSSDECTKCEGRQGIDDASQNDNEQAEELWEAMNEENELDERHARHWTAS